MLSILFAALLPALAAQDGGKISWIGKDKDPVESVFDDLRKVQQPWMVFFSVNGDPACKALCDGAFSHPDVVAASSRITCIFVECGAKKNAALVKKFSITSFPSLVLFDRDGKILGDVPQRDGPGLAAALHKLNDAMDLLPAFPEDLEAALAAARTQKRPLMVYFYDSSPACLALNRSLLDPELKPLYPKFGAARVPMKRGSPLCSKYDVDHAPTLLVLNPLLPKPEEKPLARITTSRSPRELRRDLEESLDAARNSGISAPVDGAKDDATGKEPAKTETLSDDEVDRKFIRSRFSLAIDLVKKGMKPKAIEVLEDVVATFPKHVETVAVKKYIEELKAQK
jgi:hypothetical protein